MAKYIIVGGVAGGATVAARLRRIDEQSQIVMLERGKNISYANCGLPYYVGGVIKERDNLLVQTPQSFSARFNVEVRVENEAVSINRAAKEITIRRVNTGEEYTESYDKLILAPGAEPIRPSLPGINILKYLRYVTLGIPMWLRLLSITPSQSVPLWWVLVLLVLRWLRTFTTAIFW